MGKRIYTPGAVPVFLSPISEEAVEIIASQINYFDVFYIYPPDPESDFPHGDYGHGHGHGHGHGGYRPGYGHKHWYNGED